MNKLYFILALALGLFSCQAQNGANKITLEEYTTMEAQDSVVVIDVRTPGEVSEGYIKGADLFINYKDSNFEEELENLDKNTTYIVYCRSGMRSNAAQNTLNKLGFTKVFDLKGGILGVDNPSLIVK